MITKKNLRLLSGFVSTQSFKQSLDTSASSIIRNQLDNAILSSRQLASQISYRSNKFIPYVDTKVNTFFSSTMLLTIVFSKIASFLDFINPSLKLRELILGSSSVGVSKYNVGTVVDAVDHAINVESFKNLAAILESVTVDDISFTCQNLLEDKDKKLDDYSRVYFSMFNLVAHKIKNSNNAYERVDVIDSSSEINKILCIKEFECCSEISIKDLIIHHTFVPLFNLIITHVHNMNDLIHKPIWDDDDDFIKYSKYVTIYDECLDCVKNFHTHLDRYIEQCVLINRNIDSYVNLLHLNATIKKSKLDDLGIFKTFYETKMKGCLPDIDLKYLSFSSDVIHTLSVTTFNDTFDYQKFKQITEKALEQAKKDCITYDDVSYSIGTYWYRDTNSGKYQLCKAFINDCMSQSAQAGQFYTVKENTTERNYLVNTKQIITKKGSRGFKQLCDSQEKCYHMMKLDGYGKYISNPNKIVYNGNPIVLNLFFEKLRNSKLIKTFEYSDLKKTTVKIDYVSDTLSIRYLEFPNTPEYNKGYDLTGLLPVSTVLTLPRYRVIETSSILGTIGSKLSIVPSDDNLKFLMTDLIDDIKVEIDQEKINANAHSCVKHILEDLVTGNEISFSNVIFDEFSKQFTPKIELFEKIFGKNYVYLENSFIDPDNIGDNYVVTRANGRIKKVCPIILTQKHLLNHTYNPKLTSKNKKYSFGFNRVKGELFTDITLDPKPEDKLVHALYSLTIDPDLFSFSGRSTLESYQIKSGKTPSSGFRKKIYFSDGNMQEVLKHTSDLTYYINADKVDRKNPHLELFNMIAYVTTTHWWSDIYASMIVNKADSIIEVLKNLLSKRPVFLIDSFYEYKAGTNNNIITKIIDCPNEKNDMKLIKISAYLNSIMFDIKLAYADIQYVLDTVELYSEFSLQGEPISTFTMTNNINMVFDGPMFNIWDIIDESLNDRIKADIKSIKSVECTTFAVQTTSEIRSLVYPTANCPAKTVKETTTIAGYQYPVLSFHKQNRILELT